MSYIYHERQLGGLCGVHCLNNLLQGPHFGPGDLAEIGVQLDQEERRLLEGQGGEGQDHQPYNVDSSADGGNFSIQVLTLALKKFHLELLPAKHPSARELMKDPPKAAEAFLCQYRDHWFAVRQVADCWWNLNSTRARPAMVSPFYMAAWLGQLGAEGYSIFLVRGASLPAPAKPHDEQKPEENFHEIFDLLEKGKRSGGNPLSGENDEEVVIPPDPDELAAAAAAAGGFGDAFPLGPGAGGGVLGAYPFAAQPAEAYHGYSPSSASRSSPAEAHLREMGYREPQIRAARELASSSRCDPSQLLMQIKGVDSSVERDGEKLGRAIQEAVLGLDGGPPDTVDQRILQLVTLLSLDEAHLQGASAHVNATVLTEFLLSVVAQRGQAWPAGAVRAASVAVELLAVAPRAAEGAAAPAGRQAERPQPGRQAEEPKPFMAHQRLEPSQVRRPVGDQPLEPPSGDCSPMQQLELRDGLVRL